MIKSACYLMKKAAASSATFIVLGGIIVLISQLLNLGTVAPAILSYLGFISVFVGLLIMLITLLALMLPKVSQRLEQCQH